MTYGQLPTPRPNTALKGGGTLITRQPVLLCRACGETFSANPGDYWNRAKGAEIVCGACEDELLVLAEQRTVTIPYETDAALTDLVRSLWHAADAHAASQEGE